MYNALIIGAGQIAGGFDTLTDNYILTHAHAYMKNENINLLGFYDVNFEKSKQMAKKWNTNAFETLDNIKNVDIVSVCVPDEYHVKTTLEISKLNPKIIFLEKPICRDIQDINVLKHIDIPILVNYSRRFSNDFQKLSKRIKKNEFGEYQSGNAFYGKGFIHNGSHMIDLLNLLIGKIDEVQFFDFVEDFYKDDVTKSAIIKFAKGKTLTLNGCNCQNYTIFEFDLIFEKARIKMLNSGFDIEIYEIVENSKFNGYKTLNLKEQIKTDLNFAMKNAIDNIINYLEHKQKLNCTLKNGYEAIMYG